jgi:ABC-type Fe3+ transport system substrate-binding protein
MGLLNKAPHPNAAKVALNWLLSREGQVAYQKASQEADSRRIDISKDGIPEYSRRAQGSQYMLTDRPEWMDMTPILKLVNEAWKPKR